jgi:hypothetical protein
MSSALNSLYFAVPLSSILQLYLLNSACCLLYVLYNVGGPYTYVTIPLLHVYTVYVPYTLILTALQHTKSPTTIT